LKHPVKNIDLEQDIFAASPDNFLRLALSMFQYQYHNNIIYRHYCDALHVNPAMVTSLAAIPYLPIQFFKSHQVTATTFAPQVVFESSGTTGSNTSRHYVKDVVLYKKSFTTGFSKFYGTAADKCIIGLLPSYLERSNSSLVYMTDELIKKSTHALSGFYLYDYEKLHSTILHNEILKQPTIVIGVTYALLDFAEKYNMQLRHTTIMETGGMKGRREELTRSQVHAQLQQHLGVSLIHSEYGMTELLSQAYSKGDGIFHTVPWMQVLIREEDDPFAIYTTDAIQQKPLTGAINIIDLANLHSCSFIATEDVGRLYANGSFEVLGRMDNSDVRGCSLLSI
jgi:phenylacetate-coenzyme A ligase PaaK-like adenylate-forming protein